MKTIDCRERRCAVGLALLLLSAAAQAQSNPLARGPDPTSDLLNATAGPFAVATASVPSSVSGYGDARLRRHDDQHQLDARPAAEPRDAALGGGGTLMAARDNPSLKAAVPMTPWSQTKSFSTVRVPTLVVGAENDSVAPVAQHSVQFYTSLPASLDKAYAELEQRLALRAEQHQHSDRPAGVGSAAAVQAAAVPPFAYEDAHLSLGRHRIGRCCGRRRRARAGRAQPGGAARTGSCSSQRARRRRFEHG